MPKILNRKLTNETYIAFRHTLGTVVKLCKYIFNKYKLSYILTAKLQTDSLESRFGAYRRLSGCTYNVSVEQILESERKLKLLGLLNIKSTKLGEFTLSDFAVKVHSHIKKAITENLDNLEPALDELDFITITDETLKILLCVASYTSTKVIENRRKGGTSCPQRTEMLQSKEEILVQCEQEETLAYFKQLNRGGLKCPSPMIISLSCNMFKLFQVFISSTYESKFLKLENQRDAVLMLGLELSGNSINSDEACICGVLLKTIIKKCVKVLSNIFINNYVKVLNEKNATKELARKLESRKRKNCKKGNEEKGLGTKIVQRKVSKLSSK